MKCVICGCPICGQYYYDHWGNKVCAIHVTNNEVARCASCGQYMVPTDSTGDGRALCGVCMSSVVMDIEEAERLKRYILRKFLEVGVEFYDKNLDCVNIEIVSPVRMAEIRQQPVNLMNKGITLTRSFSGGFGPIFNTKARLEHQVYMLSYLTRVEFAATLAHEILHIWQNENGIKLPPMKCEGLCNMGAYMIYEDMNSLKVSFFKKSMVESPDPIYGDGFRYMLAEREKHGLKRLFEMAKQGQL